MAAPLGGSNSQKSLPRESCKLFARDRVTKVKTLRLLAAVAFQEVELLCGFHSFRNRPHGKTSRETDNRLHDRLIFRIIGNSAHKGLIDLQLGGPEPFQVTERGVARPEVIDRD